MSTRHFVSGSSILLAGWLGATFLNEVPAQRYPKLDRTPATAKAETEPKENGEATLGKSPAFQVSISH